MSEIPRLSRCTLYVPGHTVHVIQVRLSWQEPGEQAPGRIVTIHRGVIGVETGDGIREYRNHETGRLRALTAEHGSDVTLDTKWDLLKLAHDGGRYCFSIASTSQPERRCSFDDPPRATTGAVAERLVTHGGYLVSARDLLSSLKKQS